MDSLLPYLAPIIMVLITVAVHVFSFGKFKENNDSFQKNFTGRFNSFEGDVKEEFKGFKKTLFGEDGRNGIVGDLHEVKSHVRFCKTISGKQEWEE